MMGVPVVTWPPLRSSENTPDRIFTASGSCRWVVKRDWPGRRLSRYFWISAGSSGMRGGQPSTTQPIAAPWLSPKLVNRNKWPKVLNDIAVPLLRGLVTRSLAAVKFTSLHLPLQGRVKRAPERPALRIPRELVPREYVDLSLRDIDQRRGRRFGDAENRHQPARGAAMGGRHRVAFKAFVPIAHARRHHLVALPARRQEVPLVVLALGDARWIALMQLGDGEAFPVAEGDFDQPRLDR